MINCFERLSSYDIPSVISGQFFNIKINIEPIKKNENTESF